MNPSRKFKMLDVRPMHAKGAEPFGVIRAKIDTLKAEEGLTVIAPFLPSPLIDLVGCRELMILPVSLRRVGGSEGDRVIDRSESGLHAARHRPAAGAGVRAKRAGVRRRR